MKRHTHTQCKPTCVLGTNESPGTNLSYGVDTISTLNHDLLSLTEFYDERGYDVVLSHNGFSGLVKTLNDGTKLRIPVTYDPFSHRWLLHYVIASSSKIAEIAGQRLEGKVQRQSVLNLRRAAQASLADNIDALDTFLQTRG